LLVEIEAFGGTFLAASLVPTDGRPVDHAFALPNDPSLIGIGVSAQAALIGSGITLGNAIDLELGP
jgi:hypothetical protein